MCACRYANTILRLLFVVALVLPVAAVGETSVQGPNQLLRDYQAAELSFQKAARVYRALRREVSKDAEMKEKAFGGGRSTIGMRLGPVPNGGKGVRVRSVMPGSLAEQAGLRAEDVVLAVDDERFDDLSGEQAVRTMKRLIGLADALRRASHRLFASQALCRTAAVSNTGWASRLSK